MNLKIITEIVAENRAFQRYWMLYTWDVNSIENKTPPIGAPNVAVTPTAMAADNI